MLRQPITIDVLAILRTRTADVRPHGHRSRAFLLQSGPSPRLRDGGAPHPPPQELELKAAILLFTSPGGCLQLTRCLKWAPQRRNLRDQPLVRLRSANTPEDRPPQQQPRALGSKHPRRELKGQRTVPRSKLRSRSPKVCDSQISNRGLVN